jgi:hypothetical protein
MLLLSTGLHVGSACLVGQGPILYAAAQNFERVQVESQREAIASSEGPQCLRVSKLALQRLRVCQAVSAILEPPSFAWLYKISLPSIFGDGFPGVEAL